MKIQIAISNRHVHLTQETAQKLGLSPNPIRWLGIGENYASDTGLQVGKLFFRLLLPFRKYNQFEVLASDCKELAIPRCYRLSGKLENAPILEVQGVCIAAIIALPHVHVPDNVPFTHTAVTIKGPKCLVIRDCAVWPTKGCSNPVMHIDKDEAMAYAVHRYTLADMPDYVLMPL